MTIYRAYYLKKVFFLTLSGIVLFSNAQTGPGGVGNATSNGLWLKADQINQANNTLVSTWLDISGNSNNANQATAGIQPLFFSTSSLNNQPIIRLDGIDDEMAVLDDPILDGTTSITFYSALRPNNLNGSPRGILGKRVTFTVSTEYAYTWFFHTGNRLNLDVHTQNNRFNTGSTTFSNATNYILSWDFDGSLSSSVRSRIRNGSSSIIRSSENSNVLPNSNQDLAIGALNVGYGTYLGADIGEIIHFNYALDTLEHILVQNYLSAKYDISVTNNNLYLQDNVSNGNYDFDMAGIGRIGSSIHNDSQGSGIVRILNPTNLDDNEFLLWGHNGGIFQAVEFTDIPAILEGRLDRVWRVNEVDGSTNDINVGDVDMRFDLSDLGPITASDLRLLIDTDNDGNFNDETAISGAVNLGSDIFEFSGVSALANNLRFTIGTINLNQTPLPVSLLNFNVNPTNQSAIDLNWRTASEFNNDFFTIEKSQNGKDWVHLSHTDGAGNSSNSISYNELDDDPFPGQSYYRLMQTDFNGKQNYLAIQSVIVNQQNSELVLFPNPAYDKLTITYPNIDINTFKVFNLLGLNITSNIALYEFQKDQLTIDLCNLSRGIYFVSVNGKRQKVYKM